MTARPGGRAVKPGLERRFFAACAAASPLSFGGNKTILPSKLSGRQASLPGHGRRRPPCASSLSFEGSSFFFLPSCRRSCLCMKIASRGGTAFSLFPFRSPTQHGLWCCPPIPLGATRAQAFFSFELQRKKCGLQIFLLAHLAGYRPQGLGAAALRLLLAQAQNPGPSELFPLTRAACLAVRGGQRGRDWRSLTNRKGKRP